MPASSSTPMTRHNLRKIAVILLLGFASGLPLALSGTALQAWYTVAGVPIVTIGILTLLSYPYVIKVLWAPFLDRYTFLSRLGRRRGWILLMQLGLTITLICMACLQPQLNPWLLAGLAFVVALFSATQDIGIDAYVTEILTPQERGMGAAMRTTGYRIAMVVSGGLALVIAAYIGWHNTYLLMALLTLLGLLVTLFASPEPAVKAAPTKLSEAFVAPLKEFFSRDAGIIILLFVILYKIGDAFVLALGTPFLLRGLGFTLQDVGMIYKVVGMLATVVGSLIGGMLIPRLGLYRALLWFGILQLFSTLPFILLAMMGKNYTLMVVAIFCESFFGGLATVAFVAFLMSLCDQRYTATQFTLLSSLSAIGRVSVGPIAGLLVASKGWLVFYIIAFFTGVPGLLLLAWLRLRLASVSLQTTMTAKTLKLNQ